MLCKLLIIQSIEYLRAIFLEPNGFLKFWLLSKWETKVSFEIGIFFESYPQCFHSDRVYLIYWIEASFVAKKSKNNCQLPSGIAGGVIGSGCGGSGGGCFG